MPIYPACSGEVKESLRSIYSHKVDSISQIRKSISPSIIVESNSIIESVDAELAAYIAKNAELIENLHHDEPACIRR